MHIDVCTVCSSTVSTHHSEKCNTDTFDVLQPSANSSFYFIFVLLYSMCANSNISCGECLNNKKHQLAQIFAVFFS